MISVQRCRKTSSELGYLLCIEQRSTKPLNKKNFLNNLKEIHWRSYSEDVHSAAKDTHMETKMRGHNNGNSSAAVHLLNANAC